MKCPKCGYTSFNHLVNCKRCNAPLNPKVSYGHHIVNSKDENIDPEADFPESAPELKDSLNNPEAITGDTSLKEFKENRISSESNIFEEKDQFKEVFDKLGDRKTNDSDQYQNTALLAKKISFFDRVKSFIPSSLYRDNIDSGEESVIPAGNLASIQTRVAAFLIDWIIVLFLSLVVFVAGLRQINMDYSYDPNTLFSILVKVYILLLFFASTYFLFLTAYCGKTLGKMFFGLEVVNIDGSQVGFYESAKRWVISILSIFPLFAGYIMAFFNDKRQCFHDRVANTVVVKSSNTYDS